MNGVLATGLLGHLKLLLRPAVHVMSCVSLPYEPFQLQVATEEAHQTYLRRHDQIDAHKQGTAGAVLHVKVLNQPDL